MTKDLVNEKNTSLMLFYRFYVSCHSNIVRVFTFVGYGVISVACILHGCTLGLAFLTTCAILRKSNTCVFASGKLNLSSWASDFDSFAPFDQLFYDFSNYFYVI